MSNMAPTSMSEPSTEPEPEVKPTAQGAAEPEIDPELVKKVVPIVLAVGIVVILLVIYVLLYRRKNCCDHQIIEKGDHPGDIGYYHNRGYKMDDAPPEDLQEGNKNRTSWVNERNGVETIPYSFSADTGPPDKTQVDKRVESDNSNIPPGYTPVTEEDRRRAENAFQQV